MTVIPIGDGRLVALRGAEQRFGAAYDAFVALTVPDDDASLADRDGWYFAGADAAEADHRLRTTIRDLISEGRFVRGDEIHSPVWWRHPPLIVAEVRFPQAGELSEIVLTADGFRARYRRHSWPLDADGQPILDETEPVRFERWSGAGGLRVAGMIHSETREILTVD